MATIQKNLVYDCSSLANFKQWAQGLSSTMSSLGWILDTNDPNSYQVNWSNVVAVPTGSPYCSTVNNGARAQGAWVSGTSYTGVGINSSGTFDIVTDGGITYACILSTSGTTAPGADATHWQPYYLEIWKSNGPNSATLPVYIRFQYTQSSSAPCINISIGTASSGTSLVAGNLFNTGVDSQIISGGASPSGGALYISNFSGDADNLRFIMWHGGTVNATQVPFVLVVDRAADQFGARTDSFVTIAIAYNNTSVGCQFLLKNGSQFPSGAAITNTPAWPVPHIPQASCAFGGQIPAFPLFPMVGFLANPAKGLVGFAWNDVQDKSLVNIYMLGASRSYLIIKNTACSYALSSTGNFAAMGILWE